MEFHVIELKKLGQALTDYIAVILSAYLWRKV